MPGPTLDPDAPVVETRELCRRFGRRWAFARVDLVVPRGERLLILGANGSGKTTLLRAIATAISPSQGTLRLFGLDPKVHPDAVRARLALLSHHTGFYEDLSARDNLRVLARLTRNNDIDIGALLDQVSLEDRKDPMRAFSMGMRKRLALAAILVQKPDLIMLDEPFAALDPSGMDAVAALIRTLPGTVLIASHLVERASALCDRAMLMDAGVPRWQGPACQAWEAWKEVHQPLGLVQARGGVV